MNFKKLCEEIYPMNGTISFDNLMLKMSRAEIKIAEEKEEEIQFENYKWMKLWFAMKTITFKHKNRLGVIGSISFNQHVSNAKQEILGHVQPF